MNRWMNLPLSVAGRVNLIKMIILPKFSYLFQNIPIFIKKSFFNLLDKSITSFIWNGKVHRIKKSALQRPKDNAGLALPNFIYYYWACNMQKILHWTLDDLSNQSEAWVQMEYGSSQYHLGSLLCSQSIPPRNTLSSNLVVYHSCRIWSQFRRHFSLNTVSVHSPIKGNHKFPPAASDPTFGAWHSKGIKSIRCLYIGGTFASFAQLSEKFDIPRTHFFRYFQIRNFVQTNIGSFPNLPPSNVLDQILSFTSPSRRLISILYDTICNITPCPLGGIKEQWETDLGEELCDSQWAAILDLIHSSSTCARHGLIQLKIVLRVHLTNAKLARIYPTIDPSCPRCKAQPADHMHMFWSCPNLTKFWSDIFNAYSKMFQKVITPNPICALFGFTPETRSIRGKAYVIVAFTSLLARRLILLSWKQHTPPSFSRWIKEIMYFLKLEKI